MTDKYKQYFYNVQKNLEDLYKNSAKTTKDIVPNDFNMWFLKNILMHYTNHIQNSFLDLWCVWGDWLLL